MKFRENDVIVSIVDISPIISEGTKGVILSILEEDKVFLVEFVDEKGDTHRRWNRNGLYLPNNKIQSIIIY